jgi:hypothetical protein
MDMVNQFFSQFLEKPTAPQTRVSRFNILCGAFYLSVGFSFLFLPNLQSDLGLVPAFQGQEEGLFRTFGFAVVVIGYLYVFGSRTNARSFGLSTVVDRLLVPLFGLYILQSTQLETMLILPLCVLDPILAIIAFVLWRKDEAEDQGS